MSVHKRLAVLMSSSALGAFAPITAWSMVQHRIYGEPDGIKATTNTLYTFIGTLPGITGFIGQEHILIGPNKNMIVGNRLNQHTVIGTRGLAVFSDTAHLLLVTAEFSGYGYSYGSSYGG